MRIGIGIDTGGTCTDAVVYNFEEKRILASAKASTTREDLSVGIEEAISKLPESLRAQAEAVALSTTLATNACVENKGGRGKLFFFGANPEIVRQTGAQYGLTVDENLFFVESRTCPNGFIEKQPDWDEFRKQLKVQLVNTDAVGVVESFAREIYRAVEKKLFINIGRILLEERYKEWRNTGISDQLMQIMGDLFEESERAGGFDGEEAGVSPQTGMRDFLRLQLGCSAALIGVGAPTHVFLPDVGKKLGARVIMPEYAGVANALGAIVGNVVTRTTLEVNFDPLNAVYLLFGKGIRESFAYLGDAKERAKELVSEKAREENIRRGGSEDVRISFEEEEIYADTTNGPTFLSYKITAVASGDYELG